MDFPGQPLAPGVLYRTGPPTRSDYDEAIADLRGARDEDPARGCGCCGDAGHTAALCHHNPLVMARRAVARGTQWRCYHCNAVFTAHAEAEAHFGPDEHSPAACLAAENTALKARVAELQARVAELATAGLAGKGRGA